MKITNVVYAINNQPEKMTYTTLEVARFSSSNHSCVVQVFQMIGRVTNLLIILTVRNGL